MPTFADLLTNHPMDVRKYIATFWGFENEELESKSGIQEFCNKVLKLDVLTEGFQSLTIECRNVLEIIAKQSGRLLWDDFIRRYGEIRIMGESRRERERPDIYPISLSEKLYYRGFIGRSFFDVKPEPKEFAYIPNEFIAVLFPSEQPASALFGQEMILSTNHSIRLANDKILDNICSYAAFLRMGLDAYTQEKWDIDIDLDFLHTILRCANIIKKDRSLDTQIIKKHLEMDRNVALEKVIGDWTHCEECNELKLTPELIIEGKPKLNSQTIRMFLLEIFKNIPNGRWWNLAQLSTDIKDQSPDFLRNAGDFDTWFIRDKRNGDYLRGFEHWEDVEGRLVEFFYTSILFWLGLADLAINTNTGHPQAIRKSKIAEEFFTQESILSLPHETKKLTALSNGILSVHPLVPRSARYQITRFCEWLPQKRGEYQYRITNQSLARAAKNSLKSKHLIALLHQYAKPPIPPNLLKAIMEWNAQSSLAQIKQGVLLKVKDKNIISMIMNSASKDLVEEVLNEETLLIKEKKKGVFISLLTEMGYLPEIDQNV